MILREERWTSAHRIIGNMGLPLGLFLVPVGSVGDLHDQMHRRGHQVERPLQGGVDAITGRQTDPVLLCIQRDQHAHVRLDVHDALEFFFREEFIELHGYRGPFLVFGRRRNRYDAFEHASGFCGCAR